MADTTDQDFQYSGNRGQKQSTPLRRKGTSSSVYLNLRSSNGPVLVRVFGNGGDNRGHYCDSYTVEGGKRYEIYNLVKESGDSSVRLEFEFLKSQTVVGCWSPDYKSEAGVLTLKGNSSGSTKRRKVGNCGAPFVFFILFLFLFVFLQLWSDDFRRSL